MQNFTEKDINKLEKYLGVKPSPGESETILWEKIGNFTEKFIKVPGVLSICVCNSLAMNAAHKDSDIDLFIITKRNRIWSVRILMTILLMVHRQRKTASQHTGKFCLSFFITEDKLDFKNLAIKNDIYLHYWIQTLKPIINRENIFQKFITVNTGSRVMNNLNSEIHLNKNKKFLTLLGDICEKVIKHFLLPKTKKSFQKLGKPFGVVISDTMLKFHDQDRRKEIRDAVLGRK